MVMMVALAGFAAPASAQFFFDFVPYSSNKAKSKKDARKTERSRRPVTAAAEDPAVKEPERKPEGPLVITVSLRKQRISVYDATGLFTEAPISSGRIGHATPTGVFSILEKNRTHYSNLYDSAPMPNMQRITWSGVALHAGQLPGYPASHGCIRLPYNFSKRLFGLTDMGTRVIVAQDPVVPQPFSHETLFAAYPSPVTATRAEAPAKETRVADASDTPHIATAATATASPVPPQLEALRTESQKEMARLAAAVPEAERARAAAIETASQQPRLVAEAEAALTKARKEAASELQTLRKAEKARDVAEWRLSELERLIERRKTMKPDAAERVARQKDALQSELKEMKARVEAAKAAKPLEAVTSAETALTEARVRRTDATKAVANAEQALQSAREAHESALRREAKRDKPVHVFISRKTQRIYARQGYETILEAPVSIASPEQPLGTHVFTVLAVDPQNPAAVRWNVSSVPTVDGPKSTARTRAEREAHAAQMAALAEEARTAQTPQTALQRVTIPAEIRLQIEDVMKPGSSLIVSDNGLSNETGKLTDFIVPVR